MIRRVSKLHQISVVISTWRRPQMLLRLLVALTGQTISMTDFEVLVIDSHSGDTTADIVEKMASETSLDVRLMNCKVNSISSKRNFGIDFAVGKFIVFLDDDCIPDQDHLSKFLDAAAGSEGQKLVWCGGVRFNEELIFQSNYYRYRNSCHFSKANPRATSLKFNEIVTMNMMVELATLRKYRINFDERFLGYGCEDVEFGWRLIQNGFVIKPCLAEIQHEELNGSILKFKEKLYHASRDGFAVLHQVAPEIVDNLGETAKLEVDLNNKTSEINFRIVLLLIVLNSKIPILVQQILFHLDKFKFAYSRFAYRFVLAAAHRRGYCARVSGSQVKVETANKNGWYS